MHKGKQNQTLTPLCVF